MVRKELAEEIESLVDEVYHGHTFASAVNTMKEDIKDGRIKVTLHDIPYPSGEPKKGGKRFASISVRDDIIDWLEIERKKQGDQYVAKYGKNAGMRLGSFGVRLIVNILLSKKDQADHTLKLKPEDYAWLKAEFEKSRKKYGVDTFEQFLPLYLRDAIRKLRD